jgi:hypothetical protein
VPGSSYREGAHRGGLSFAQAPHVCSWLVPVVGPARGLRGTPGAPRGQASYARAVASIYLVRFADGSGQSFYTSVEEARRWIDRRADRDPPPPGILPAEILEWTEEPPWRERLVESYPSS